MKYHLPPICLLFYCMLLAGLYASAQNGDGISDSLYYFQNPDSAAYIGVKNAKGSIVIPAEFSNVYDLEPGSLIQGPIIEFMPRPKNSHADPSSPAIAASEVYDRNGRFLYFAQSFDNGSDYFVEGLRRYVEHQKIGFVDLSGKKKITARWDFATPFNYGYARVYAGGWKRKLLPGGEHWIVVPKVKSAYSYVINTNGQRVKPLAKLSGPLDYQMDGKYYPYPFTYNAKEKRIRDHLSNYPDLKKSISTQYLMDSSMVQFEIIQRPTKHFPYYIFQGYENGKSIEDMTLLSNQQGDQFYHCQYQGYVSEINSLGDWIKENYPEAALKIN